MKMLVTLGLALMAIMCNADEAPDNPGGFLGPCAEDIWNDAFSGGYCTFYIRDRCTPINGPCGWGTQIVRYTCGDFGECSCQMCCWVPCQIGEGQQITPCASRYKHECEVANKCPCSKTCGVGNSLVHYKCPNQPNDVSCLEECCCKPCEGRGISKPARPCRGEVVVPREDRKECCSFTLFEVQDPTGDPNTSPE